MDKSPRQTKFLYKVLYFIMDVESLLWDIADFIIKPVAKCRQLVTRKIGKNLGLTESKIEVKEKTENEIKTLL